MSLSLCKISSMTKYFKLFFSLLFGLYFLVAGTGFNVVKYCCESCENAGIENVAENTCQHFHHASNHSSCCHVDKINLLNEIEEDAQKCSLERFQVETPSLVILSQRTNEGFYKILLFSSFIPTLSSFLLRNDSLLAYSTPVYLSSSSGRDILRLNSVLLI